METEGAPILLPSPGGKRYEVFLPSDASIGEAEGPAATTTSSSTGQRRLSRTAVGNVHHALPYQQHRLPHSSVYKSWDGSCLWQRTCRALLHIDCRLWGQRRQGSEASQWQCSTGGLHCCADNTYPGSRIDSSLPQQGGQAAQAQLVTADVMEGLRELLGVPLSCSADIPDSAAINFACARTSSSPRAAHALRCRRFFCSGVMLLHVSPPEAANRAV